MSIQSRIIKKFKKGDYEDFTFTKIAAEEALVTDDDRKKLRAILSSLEKEDIIYYYKGKYRLSKKEKFKNPEYLARTETVTGEIRANEKGFGFLVTDSGDYYISPENMGYAIHGDICECAVIDGKNGKKDAAIVLKILDHSIKRLAGTFFTEGAFAYLRPDEPKYLCDILIKDLCGFAPQTGDKVFVEITDFPKRACPQGKIAAHLGRRFELFAEEKSLIYSYGFYDDFPDSVKNAARSIDLKVDDNRLIGRLNLEDKLIFTIDGDTAKDYDDAVSLETDSNSNYLLGVHIADVSEYVEFNGEIDKEAYKRGTSAYFPDTVVPMLPFELSNGICSLSEGATRLTLSVFATIDKGGNVIDRSFHESFIKSQRRMTYKNVDKILQGDSELCEKYADIAPTLNKMLELKNLLENKKKEDGYIDLAVKDADVFIDEGEISVELHKATDSTKIIEQFMILANELVAENLFYLNVPCVYRIHPKPDKAKTDGFKEFLKALGINVLWRRDELYPSDYQRLLEQVKGSDKFAVVNRAMLRSLKKAVYSTENDGHFGLASKCYCHFTSPIRRYPDLAVHRILKAVLRGDIGAITDLYADFLVNAAKHSSDKERLADEAERAVDDLYKAKYMEKFIDEEFSGVISGVTRYGLYVELENTCEGFVPIEFLPGIFEYDEATFSLKSKKRSFKLGDKMDVVLVGVDIGERKCEFLPAPIKRGLPKNKKCGKI